jgi:hypothetical protein
MAYTKYSLTPSSNTAAPPDGAPEGMLPSAVNDTMRDMMSQIRDCGDGIRGGTYTMTAPIITGGSINGATVGATTATTGKFTTLQATSTLTLSDGSTILSHNPPTVTVYTSGSGTYTTPTNAKYLFVQMVGGGGGGGSGSTANGSAGGTGGTTTFGSSFLTCTGGTGGGGNNTPNPGDVSTAPSGGDLNVRGGVGIQGLSASTIYYNGGTGGATVFGTGAIGGFNGSGSGAIVYGSGGGGGGISLAPGSTGGGGGAGGYLEKTISSPLSTYSYAVGAGGSASSTSTNGYAGGAGAGGVIIVTAYF